ncbi:hypothetical protein [Sphingobacterium mizutaii]|uniref:hypothetical protein n=1 Tax=Sphingobacterium mizutaii TaxID=1010 RepID=UPI0012FDAC7A|nr:hypothetical protein [Sphingobacterium mizutaii]
MESCKGSFFGISFGRKRKQLAETRMLSTIAINTARGRASRNRLVRVMLPSMYLPNSL